MSVHNISQRPSGRIHTFSVLFIHKVVHVEKKKVLKLEGRCRYYDVYQHSKGQYAVYTKIQKS
jgi:hypothetical protein